jgi:hypothetical protein
VRTLPRPASSRARVLFKKKHATALNGPRDADRLSRRLLVGIVLAVAGNSMSSDDDGAANAVRRARVALHCCLGGRVVRILIVSAVLRGAGDPVRGYSRPFAYSFIQAAAAAAAARLPDRAATFRAGRPVHSGIRCKRPVCLSNAQVLERRPTHLRCHGSVHEWSVGRARTLPGTDGKLSAAYARAHVASVVRPPATSGQRAVQCAQRRVRGR